MITGGIMELHIERSSEGAEEPRNRFGTSIGGDMSRNTMFREYMKYKKLS
jgi:hypothetical protein